MKYLYWFDCNCYEITSLKILKENKKTYKLEWVIRNQLIDKNNVIETEKQLEQYWSTLHKMYTSLDLVRKARFKVIDEIIRNNEKENIYLSNILINN